MMQLHEPVKAKNAVIGRGFAIVEAEPLRKDGSRDVKNINDQALIEISHLISRWGIAGRAELEKADRGLYTALRKRKLLDSVGLERKQRDWAAMTDEELAGFAKSFIAERGVKGRKELEKEDTGLYTVLWKRKLLDSVGFEEKRRDWASISDEALNVFAKGVIQEKGIEGRSELKKVDMGLYIVLRKRELLDGLGLEEGLRDWASMKAEELVGFAKIFVAERGIGGRSELNKADIGLYQALRRRKLLDAVGLEEKRRDWVSIGDEELAGIAKEFIAEKGIVGRGELQREDRGLYQALRKRKLLDSLGLEGKYRDLASMSDDEIVGFAKTLVEEKGITGRGKLEKADGGLYQALRKRKLLDAVGLEEKRRDWVSIGDEELAGIAKEFIAEKGIVGRGELQREDRGLYQALRKRKLLDAVFSEVESERHRDAVLGVIEAVGSFGDTE